MSHHSFLCRCCCCFIIFSSFPPLLCLHHHQRNKCTRARVHLRRRRRASCFQCVCAHSSNNNCWYLMLSKKTLVLTPTARVRDTLFFSLSRVDVFSIRCFWRSCFRELAESACQFHTQYKLTVFVHILPVYCCSRTTCLFVCFYYRLKTRLYI